MPRLTAAAAIVQSLITNGIDTLFCLPGVQLDPLFNALYDAKDKIRVIQSRHEQGAAYMALGYAASTGGVGAYAVVPGPGLLNTTAALSTAYATNARVLCLTGQVQSDFIGRGVGLLHEIPDQLGVLRSLTKWAERIESPAQAPAMVAEAFRQLLSGRPRPAGLEMAMDLLGVEAEMELLPPTAGAGHPAVDPDAIAEAARMLGRAESPLIFIGGGATDAGEEIAAVAEILQAPVVASPNARGVVSSRHPFSHTMPAGHRLWETTDAVLAVGTRLQRPLMNWGTDNELRIVRIDIDPEEPGRVADPVVSLVADCRDALRELIPQLERHNRKRAGREAESLALKGEIAATIAPLEPQLSYVNAIRAELPEDGIFVEELTQVAYVSRFAMPVYRPRTFITTGYQGTLGWGFASALGVKIAHPDTPVLSIAGDGGFLFTAQELATAVQHGIGLVTLVFSDGAYGNVKRMQKELYGNRVIASELHNPDFVKLAESFGAQGLRAETPEALRQAIRRGFASTGAPTVIEIPVGEMPAPWPYVVMPRVRGKEPARPN